MSDIEVSQADREAAAELNWLTDPKYAFNLKHGLGDRNQLVQAFARHRASAEATSLQKTQTTAERVREACAKVCDEVERQQDIDHGAANTGGAAACGAAIRSLPIGGE